ncbi:MAG TPA: hypothetical protein VF695_14330 [Sphingomonas sp.]|jgi:hypothetical protein
MTDAMPDPSTELYTPLARRDLTIAIDRLTVSADAKVILTQLSDLSVTVGDKVIAIGRRILSFVLHAVKTYPNTSFGLVIGIVMTLLIGSMALIGGLLAPILGPLLMALGIGVGALADIRNSGLRDRIRLFELQVLAASGG